MIDNPFKRNLGDLSAKISVKEMMPDIDHEKYK